MARRRVLSSKPAKTRAPRGQLRPPWRRAPWRRPLRPNGAGYAHRAAYLRDQAAAVEQARVARPTDNQPTEQGQP